MAPGGYSPDGGDPHGSWGRTHSGVAVGLPGAHHARLAMYPARGLTGMRAMGRGIGRHPSQPCTQQLTQPTTWDQRSLDRTPPPLACPPGAARSVAAGPPPEADPRPSAARWRKIWPRHSGLFVSTNGWGGGGCAGGSRQPVPYIHVHACTAPVPSLPAANWGDHKLGYGSALFFRGPPLWPHSGPVPSTARSRGSAGPMGSAHSQIAIQTPSERERPPNRFSSRASLQSVESTRLVKLSTHEEERRI